MMDFEIENRLERIAELYSKIEEIINNLPFDLSNNHKVKIINFLVGDEKLRELVNGIKDRRPPRFVLMGRTGAGKSSLINAMCGRYLAQTSDVEIGTKFAKKYSYEFLGKTIFEIIDTRGIGESQTEVEQLTAEQELKKVVSDFSPDAIMFLVRSKGRDYIDKDIDVLKKVCSVLSNKVPIIALSTQVDELEPSDERLPQNFSDRKLRNIEKAVLQLKQILIENGVTPIGVLPISSHIVWDEDPTETPENNWHKLQILRDGRYNINTLLDLLENNIDIRAGIHLMLMTRLDLVARKIAEKLTMSFTGISAVVALTPIPVSDVFILLVLQVMLVMLIAYLSGKDLSFDSAKDVLIALAGTGMLGYGLRTVFQQLSKFVPIAGMPVSAAIASSGTYGIGHAAIAYYLDNVPIGELHNFSQKASEEYKKRNW